MPKSAMIRARMEPELKREVEEIFRSLGLNTTEALSLFYNQVKIRNGIPFEIKLYKERQKSSVSKISKEKLCRKVKSMTPQERLEAFFHHSYFIGQVGKTKKE